MTDPASGDGASRRRAAQYVRMSTEHQQYSTANQQDALYEYAQRRQMEIVQTYADEGKSGLSFSGRTALQRLISDVQSGQADFSVILVYDVSRWGRFQDADESAYYEYLCKRAGIEVHYCAEQFENDGGPASTIIKSVKRAMAGEYSRELSSKVFKGQCRLIELGFRQGGSPGFGLRRMLMNASGEQKGVLHRGEQKSLQMDRVVLVPGPDEELQIVRQIYDWFTHHGKQEREIAELLNDRGVLTDLGRPWNRGTVRQVLTNEKYIGNNVYNRTSFKLKRKHVRNPSQIWVRADGAFAPVVSSEQFFVARGIVLERNRRFSDEELLNHLRGLISQHTTLSSQLIDSADGMPSAAVYRTRFGSLVEAYRLAGFVPERNYDFIEINRRLHSMHPGLVDNLVGLLANVDATVRRDAQTGFLIINEQFTASLFLSRCRQTTGGALRWIMHLNRQLTPDITILVRMDTSNAVPVDYYLLPIMDIAVPKLLLCEANGAALDTYQFDSLDYLTVIAKRQKLEIAA
ncbi:MAG: recombinase family protein [Pirellulales bacterium]|nr:recombinase family protein [Pirellulales bacterium]